MNFSAAESLLRYLKAYAAKDIDQIAAQLAPDVRLQDWNLAVQGATAVLDETRKNFQAASRLDIEVVQVLADARSAAAVLRISVGEASILDVVDVVTFDDQGRITAIRAFKG